MTDLTKKSLYFVNSKAPVRFIDSTTDAHDGCIYHLVVVGENGEVAGTGEEVKSIDEYDFGDGNKVNLNEFLEGTTTRNKAKHGIPIVLKYDCSTKTVTGVKALVQDFTSTAQDNDPTDDSMVFNPATAATIIPYLVPRNNGRIAVQGDKILVAVLLDTEQIYKVNSDGKIIVDGVEHTVSNKATVDDPTAITVMFQLNRTNFKVVRIIEPGNPIGTRRTMDNTTVDSVSRNTDCIFDMVVDNGGYVYYMGMVGFVAAATGVKFSAGLEPIEFKNLEADLIDTNGRRSTFLLKLNRKLEVVKAVHVGFLKTDSNQNNPPESEFNSTSSRRFTLALDANKLYLAGQTGHDQTKFSIGEKTLEDLAENRPILLAVNKNLQYSHHRFFNTDEGDRFTDIKVNGSGIFVCGLHKLSNAKTGGLPSSYYTEADANKKTAGIFKVSHNRKFDILNHYYVESNADRSGTMDETELFYVSGTDTDTTFFDAGNQSYPVLEVTPSGVFLSIARLLTSYRPAGASNGHSGTYFVPPEQTASGKPIEYACAFVNVRADVNGNLSKDMNSSTAVFYLNMKLKVKNITMFGNSMKDNTYIPTINHTHKLVHSGNSVFGMHTVRGSDELHELLIRDAQFPSRPLRYPWDKLYDVNDILTADTNRDRVISGVFEYGFKSR